MKIASLYCSGCSSEVPIDHYRSGECPAPPMPIAWLLGIQEKETNDKQHADNRMTASRIASCPRQIAIQDNIPMPGVNLESFNSAAWGTAVHEYMKRHTPTGMESEVELSGVLFKGTRYEIQVFGTADLLVPNVALIEDYKTTNVFSQQKVCKNPHSPKLEWVIQVSIYRLLYEVMDLERGAVWSGSMPAKVSGVRPWIRVPIQFMTEEEILAARPFDGQRTIAEHIDIWKQFLADKEKMPIREAVARIPLVGVEQAAFMCQHCAVEPECSKMARGL